MNSIIDNFKGGDLRSIGNVNEVVNTIKSQKEFDKLFNGLFHNDRKVVMRTADAIEKITLINSEFLKPHKTKVIELSFNAKHIELKWHMALLLSRLQLTENESVKVWQLLTDWATDKKESKIVRVNSIQSLYSLLCNNSKFQQDFNLTIAEILKENIPSINARIRKIKYLIPTGESFF